MGELESVNTLGAKYADLVKLIETAHGLQKEIKQLEQEVLFLEKSNGITSDSPVMSI